MRIIKPYGASRSEKSQNSLERLLYDRSAHRTRHKIIEFAENNAELVIAQWISVIDKIATKPHGKNGASQAQREFREKLGKTAWTYIIGQKLLVYENSERLEYLHALWNFKIHPYGNAKFHQKTGSRQPRLEGRWYKTFVGDVEVKNIDFEKIVQAISKHLYENEYKLHPTLLYKSSGKMRSRAESISLNVLKDNAPRQISWNEADVSTYVAPGDVAYAIYEAVKLLEKENKPVKLEVAGKILFEHWPKVFYEHGSGKILSIKDAQATYPGLFAIHMAIKETYTRILKNHRKNTQDHRRKNKSNRKVSDVLPTDMDALLQLHLLQVQNSDLSSLVRLGKIIHYHASGRNVDNAFNIQSGWATDVSNSVFWTSDGQSEIKRAEAFVRVWRHIIGYMGVTLRNFSSLKVSFDNDILGSSKLSDQACGKKNFDKSLYEKKLSLFFGNRSPLFILNNESDCKDVLRAAIDYARGLRNKSFHFAGRGAFLSSLESISAAFQNQPLTQTRKLWDTDILDRGENLKRQLQAVQVDKFFNQRQVQSILDILYLQPTHTHLPLPKLTRVLLRAKNAWEKDKSVFLPSPVNRLELEIPARLCQFTLVKLIYEKSFSRWLESQQTADISKWIDQAIERADKAAKDLNACGDDNHRKIISSRAAHLQKPTKGANIKDFIFDLTAATASEMRVQRGYESDGEKAREQAAYIDDFLCDVIIHAFCTYIREENLQWLLELSSEQPPSEKALFDLSVLQLPASDLSADDWQVCFYFLLHFVPVEEAGKLLHQITKWMITSGRDTPLSPDETERLDKLVAVLNLYLDMHDQKFEGGPPIDLGSDFQRLFANEAGFNKVFLPQSNTEPDLKIPFRGLREIKRFGHFPLILSTAGDKISELEISAIKRMEALTSETPSAISEWQKKREKLHETWAQRKRLSAEELRSYCEALSLVVRHRQGATRIYLNDNVRLHRLLMAVLARLVDYAGIFERDLYFVTLALIYRQGLTPSGLFNPDGLLDLQKGQILSALGRLNQIPQAISIKQELSRYFGDVWKASNQNRDIRNNIAHLNMLQGKNPNIDLTFWANQTRVLMGYDRKLKNAVSKSIIELLQREGLSLAWDMQSQNGKHELTHATVSARSAVHLGGQRLVTSKGRKLPIRESLHSQNFVKAVALLFKGTAIATLDIQDVNLQDINWKDNVAGRSKKSTTADHARHSCGKRKAYRKGEKSNHNKG